MVVFPQFLGATYFEDRVNSAGSIAGILVGEVSKICHQRVLIPRCILGRLRSPPLPGRAPLRPPSPAVHAQAPGRDDGGVAGQDHRDGDESAGALGSFSLEVKSLTRPYIGASVSNKCIVCCFFNFIIGKYSKPIITKTATATTKTMLTTNLGKN